MLYCSSAGTLIVEVKRIIANKMDAHVIHKRYMFDMGDFNDN